MYVCMYVYMYIYIYIYMVPSSSAVRAVEAEEATGSSSTPLRRAGSVCAKGHTKFVEDSDSD